MDGKVDANGKRTWNVMVSKRQMVEEEGNRVIATERAFLEETFGVQVRLVQRSDSDASFHTHLRFQEV